jgi:hypothetical protein
MNMPFEEIKSFIVSIVSLSDDEMAEIVGFIEVKFAGAFSKRTLYKAGFHLYLRIRKKFS